MVSIAIAIPNLNGANFLPETLRSLQNQIEKPDEIVFSDNNSSDDSLEILKSFPDLNIRVVQPDSSLTMSENWNYAVTQTKSDWFFLLSNDDLLRNNSIKKLREVVNGLSPNIGVVSFKSEIIDENSKLILGKFKFGRPKLREEHEFLKQNIKFLHVNAASVAIKKETWSDVGGFPVEYAFLHDLVFYQRVFSNWRILESKEVLGRYRIYRNKPNSAARSKLVAQDFQTYENSDLRSYAERFPDLLMRYQSAEVQNSASTLKRMLRINHFRVLGLSIMTVCRRIQSIFNFSGL